MLRSFSKFGTPVRPSLLPRHLHFIYESFLPFFSPQLPLLLLLLLHLFFIRAMISCNTRTPFTSKTDGWDSYNIMFTQRERLRHLTLAVFALSDELRRRLTKPALLPVFVRHFESFYTENWILWLQIFSSVFTPRRKLRVGMAHSRLPIQIYQSNRISSSTNSE